MTFGEEDLDNEINVKKMCAIMKNQKIEIDNIIFLLLLDMRQKIVRV